MKFILVVLALVSLSAAQPRPHPLKTEVVTVIKSSLDNMKKFEAIITVLAKFLKDNKGSDVFNQVLGCLDLASTEVLFLVAVKMLNPRPMIIITDYFRKFDKMVQINKAIGYSEEDIYAYTAGNVFAHLQNSLADIVTRVDPSVTIPKAINIVKLADYTPTKVPTADQKEKFNTAFQKMTLYGNDQKKVPFDYSRVVSDKDVNGLIHHGLDIFYEKLSDTFVDPDVTIQLNDAYKLLLESGGHLMEVLNKDLRFHYPQIVATVVNAFREGIVSAQNDLYRKYKTVGQTPSGNAPAANPPPPHP